MAAVVFVTVRSFPLSKPPVLHSLPPRSESLAPVPVLRSSLDTRSQSSVLSGGFPFVNLRSVIPNQRSAIPSPQHPVPVFPTLDMGSICG
jgi:hypothetical protein